jgi:hypothetical protein
VTVNEIKLPDEPILILQFTVPLNPFIDVTQMERAIVQTASQIDGRLFVVADCSRMEVSFSEVVIGMAEYLRRTSPETYPFISVLVESQDRYGCWNLPLFDTLDDALIYLRCRFSSSKPEGRIHHNTPLDGYQAFVDT